MILRTTATCAGKRPLLVLFGLCTTLLFASTALANQGTRFTGGGLKGTRAYLSGTMTVPASGGAIATVRVQSAMTSGAGLMQVGPIRHGSSFSSNCGAPGLIGTMVERRSPGGTYLCTAYFGSASGNARFAVVKRATADNCWQAFVNGGVLETRCIGFATGNMLAVGEYNGSAPSPYSFTFGPSGQTAWQYTTNNGTSYVTITSATASNGGGWIIGSPPSPFTISR